MLRRPTLLLLCGMFVSAGCLDLDLEVRPPPAPDGFPQPGKDEDARAELTVDGQSYVTEYAYGLSYNVEGGYEDQLRASLDLDDLDLDFRDIEPGVTTVAGGDLTAQWESSWEADAGCGDGRLEIMGLRSYDSGLYDERDFVWGTVQFELCDRYPSSDEVPARIEVTGRFTAVVDYN